MTHSARIALLGALALPFAAPSQAAEPVDFSREDELVRHRRHAGQPDRGYVMLRAQIAF